MKGHYTPTRYWTNEVWGLDTFKSNKDLYLSCSDDATLRIYSTKKRRCLKIIRLDVNKLGKIIKLKKIEGKPGLPKNKQARSVGISPDDSLIVIGMNDGTCVVGDISIDEDNISWNIKSVGGRRLVFKPARNKKRAEWISEIKFSPDGTRVAIGSHDN